MNVDRRVFCIKRNRNGQTLYAVAGVSAEPVVVSLLDREKKTVALDLLSDTRIDLASVELKPYQVRWLSLD